MNKDLELLKIRKTARRTAGSLQRAPEVLNMLIPRMVQK